jgi:hypothetical protein
MVFAYYPSYVSRSTLLQAGLAINVRPFLKIPKAKKSWEMWLKW